MYEGNVEKNVDVRLMIAILFESAKIRNPRGKWKWRKSSIQTVLLYTDEID